MGWEDTLEKAMAMHSGILPGEAHGQMSLAGYSPWGHKESDTTEQLTLSHLCFSYITNTSESQITVSAFH